MTNSIELKRYPEVKAVIRAAFPKYHRLKANVSVFSEQHGHSINSHWEDGSRDEFAIVELATGQTKKLPTRTHPFYDLVGRGIANRESEAVSVDGRGNLTLKILPEGFALVQAGTFNGKPATAHIYLNPANMVKLLTAPPAAVICSKCQERAVTEGLVCEFCTTT